jgi:hypothetical protein
MIGFFSVLSNNLPLHLSKHSKDQSNRKAPVLMVVVSMSNGMCTRVGFRVIPLPILLVRVLITLLIGRSVAFKGKNNPEPPAAPTHYCKNLLDLQKVSGS